MRSNSGHHVFLRGSPLRSAAARRALALLLALIAGAPSALADNHPGADVIVGDLPDCNSYGTVGSGGLYAYAVGTTACNVGNANLRWQPATSFHPVIAQNVYRLKDGRFEQIGQSWVKHGFYAFGQTLCGTCNNQGGTTLGVGCSDPYDNGLNGEQAGLGPRSEINASTGVFPFAVGGGGHNWPPIADELSRRIQIAATDLTLPANNGAAYFAEGLYVTPDDAAAGNGWNNASHRAITFNTGSANLTMSLTGPIFREQPALFAWRAADPQVHIAGYEVPGDGRFLIGESVTDNGDGTWHYEYAAFNLSSDRSGGGFTVPIIAGTTITNAQFHGVPSHSGEPYMNDAWGVSITANAVTFAPAQTFAVDPNANALRWGTLYNFRFDASTPPAAGGGGSIRVSLFKPGSGVNAGITGFTLAARTPGGATASVSPPTNDDCAGTTIIHPGQNRSTTLGATGNVTTSCGPIQNDAWFRYVFQPYAPSCTGAITLDTCGSEFDTSIAVYGGIIAAGCPDIPGSQIACNDDGPACTGGFGGAGSSSCSFPATPGVTYLIRVGSPNGTRGNLVLNLSVPFCIAPNGACCLGNGACQVSQGAASCYNAGFLGSGTVCAPNPCPQPPPPVNDQCAGALGIGDSAMGWPSMSGNNYRADTTVNDLCAFGAQGLYDVWYAYVPTIGGPVVIDTCQLPASGAALDTLLSIHQGACSGPLLACNDNAFGYCIPGSRIEPTLAAGTLYYIRVAGYTNFVGDFVLRVTGGGGAARGACCWGTACTQSSPTGCAGTNRVFAGLSTTCNPAANGTSPCCQADFNHVNGLSVQDIFDYLNAWFDGSVSTAVGGNGIRSPVVQDIFDFLGLWFTAC